MSVAGKRWHLSDVTDTLSVPLVSMMWCNVFQRQPGEDAGEVVISGETGVGR